MLQSGGATAGDGSFNRSRPVVRIGHQPIGRRSGEELLMHERGVQLTARNKLVERKARAVELLISSSGKRRRQGFDLAIEGSLAVAIRRTRAPHVHRRPRADADGLRACESDQPIRRCGQRCGARPTIDGSVRVNAGRGDDVAAVGADIEASDLRDQPLIERCR